MLMNSYSDRPYPLFRRNLKLEEMYRKIDERNNKFTLKRKMSKKALVWMFVLFLFAISTPFTITKLQEIQELRSQASLAPLHQSFEAEEGIVSGHGQYLNDFLASGGKYIDFGSAASGDVDIANCVMPTATSSVKIEREIASDGTYFLWVRMGSTDESANAMFLSIDNMCPVLIGGSPIPKSTWAWVNTSPKSTGNRVIADLTSGRHSFVFYPKSTGMKFDKMLITTNQNCIPLLKGDNCLEKLKAK